MMWYPQYRMERRKFLGTAAAGALGTVVSPAVLGAATRSESEERNGQIVNKMCEAWVAPFDPAPIGALLAEDCIYRASETTPPMNGRDSILEFIQTIMNDVTGCEFEVVESFARGPIVMNDRWDRFDYPSRKSEFHVVGVFFMKDGLISEWTDYLIP